MQELYFAAKQYALKYRHALMMTLLYVGLYISLRDLATTLLGGFGLIITVLTIAIEHAKVKVGLDVLEDTFFIPQQEASVGVRDVKRYFSTYVWMMIIVFVFFIVGFVALVLVFKPYFITLLEAIQAEMEYGIYASYTQMTGGIMLITNICLFFSELVFNIFFFSAPYLTETKGVTGLKSIKAAFQLQKGHFKQCLQLFAHYFVYMVIFTCIQYLILHYVDATLLASLLDIAVTLIAIFVYESEYVVSKALFFKYLLGVKQHD